MAQWKGLKLGPLRLAYRTWKLRKRGTVYRVAPTPNSSTWASLDVAEGLRVQKPEQLWDMIRETWGKPQLIVLDRFRVA